MLNVLKDWNVKKFFDYMVVGLLLVVVITLIHSFILPMVVKLIPGTIFSGTITLTDILLFMLLILTVTRK